MDIHNFKLGSVFQDNAKEYVTRPVMAAENGGMVYFTYIKVCGELVEIAVVYDSPKPVLCRKDDDAINKEVYIFILESMLLFLMNLATMSFILWNVIVESFRK